MINQYLVCETQDDIEKALMKIESTGEKTVFVIDENRILNGVLTDGDIRRALLNGFELDTKIKKIMKKDFVYAYDYEETQEVLRKFNYAIQVIPVVNKNFELVDYYKYNTTIKIPISQPELGNEELSNLIDAYQSTWISSTGKYITEFEQNFSEYCRVKYGVATSNGTTALHLALVALGIGKGDEVIVPDITFAATINAVIYTGATPVIVDIEKDAWCISPIEIEKAITEKTKAIIPVHIYGQPCDMELICKIAKEHGLYIVEDCAEAHGAEFNGKKVGSFGDIACFSFFGNKVITTGEGGMCITNDKSLEDKMRLLRDHGMSKERKYYHEVIGFNYRMTNLQAAIGVAQLKKIDIILKWRNELEEQYRSILSNIDGIKIQENNLPKRKKITWLVTIVVNEHKRDKYMFKLKDEGIDARPFFTPLSEMDIYKDYVFSNTNSIEISKKGFNLPTSIDIGKDIIRKIANILADNKDDS